MSTEPDTPDGGATPEETSDALERANMDGPKPTELVPPTTNLDVDIADLSDRHRRGEHPPLILAGYWVKLGYHDDVPERYRGSIATIVTSPFTNVPFASDGDETIHGYRYDKDKQFMVRTRGEGEASFEVPFEAFESYSDSRATLLNYA